MDSNEIIQTVKRMYAIVSSGNGTCERSYADIARRVGVTTSAIRHIISGRSTAISVNKASAILMAYKQLLTEKREEFEAEIQRVEQAHSFFEPEFFHDEIKELRVRLAQAKAEARRAAA